MARAVISGAERRAALEPFYDIDPRTGAGVEVFYADRVLARSFSARGAGWFWWTYQCGRLLHTPTGPFGTSYAVYRNALDSFKPVPGLHNHGDARRFRALEQRGLSTGSPSATCRLEK